MDRQGKEALRQEVAGYLGESSAIFLAEYRGLTVEQVTKLRLDLRKHNAKFKVTKNRVVKKAVDIEAKDFDGLQEKLKGPLGIVYAYGDSAQAAKTVLDFEKEHEKFKVTCGVVDHQVVDKAKLEQIASLPSKEVLLGQIVGSLVAPHRGLIGVLSGVSRQLVQVINAIKDQKSE